MNPKVRLSAAPGDKALVQLLIDKITELTAQAPAKAATILTGWVNQGIAKPAGKKKVA